MKYKVGESFTIREDLPSPYSERKEGVKSEEYLRVNPVEYFFRGYRVEVVKVYSEHNVKGYGVIFGGASREFFVHKSHIKED